MFSPHPLLRQLLGAAIGTLVAMMIYGIYTVAAPHVAAMLPARSSVQTAEFTEQSRLETQQRIIEKARENLQHGN